MKKERTPMERAVNMALHLQSVKKEGELVVINRVGQVSIYHEYIEGVNVPFYDYETTAELIEHRIKLLLCNCYFWTENEFNNYKFS